MVTRNTIASRLDRFEALVGLEYSHKACDIWLEKFKDWEEEIFITACEKVENTIKWHILPTPADVFEALSYDPTEPRFRRNES